MEDRATTMEKKMPKSAHKVLFKEALKVRKNAHAPYSKFKVGAALLDDRGRIFTGCNFENSSYGGTICAERNAIGAMVSAGGRSVKEILVVTDIATGCPPCGICRQVLAEFVERTNSSSNVLIHIANTKKVVATYKFSDMLPHAFDGTFLA